AMWLASEEKGSLLCGTTAVQCTCRRLAFGSRVLRGDGTDKDDNCRAIVMSARSVGLLDKAPGAPGRLRGRGKGALECLLVDLVPEAVGADQKAIAFCQAKLDKIHMHLVLLSERAVQHTAGHKDVWIAEQRMIYGLQPGEHRVVFGELV